MTTPNTEPKPRPATDEQVATIKAGLERAFPARTAPDLAAQMVSQILIARIEQEREMKREFQALLAKLRMDRNFRLYVHDTYLDQSDAVLARAAKMEADNAK